MSLIEGEGRVALLYGPTPRPRPPYKPLYVARPDYAGRFGAVIVVHDRPGPSPTMKAYARRIARFGYAVLLAEPDDLDDAVSALEGAWSEWARGPVCFVGVGAGIPGAAAAAGEASSPLVLMSPGPEDGARLPGDGPLLVVTTAEDAAARRDEVGRGVWAVYRDRPADFWDDGSDGFVSNDAEDALRRIVAFLDRHVGVPAGV